MLFSQQKENQIQEHVNKILKESDWGGLLIYQKQNKLFSTADFKKYEVVFMGDSITEGWSFYFPDFFSENNYINRGISGQTTAQMLLRFRQDVIDLNPKVLVILAGINDIARNTKFYSNEVIAGNIFSMVELAKANGIIPIICSILPADRFNWSPEISPVESVKEVNSLLKLYAKENGVIYLDYYKHMHNKAGGLKKKLTNDGVHVTKMGYELMSQLVKKSIQEIINIR